MKTIAGIWIDHKEAVIVFVSPKGQETKVIQSNVEKQQGRIAGVRSKTRFESAQVPADDRQQRSFTFHLNGYYDKVAKAVGGAASILLFGPGEAKGELKKRIKKLKSGKIIIEVETAGKMTDRQIAAKVRKHFLVGDEK